MTQIPPLDPSSISPGPVNATPPPAYAGPPGQQPIMVAVPQQPRRSRVGLWILGLLLAGSIFGNLLLLLGLLGVCSTASMDGAGNRPLQQVVLEPAATTDTIAVIRVEGIITEEPLGGWGARGTDYQFLKKQVDQALADDKVKAVILKVDSPGGGASASDMMLHELQRLHQEHKPVVVHMGSLAASGGYYVSMAGDEIIAQPTCITGSIGVIGQVMNFQELMGDKLGIKVYTFKSGDFKDVGNPFRAMTPEEQSYMQNTLIVPMYERFLSIVVAGRKNLQPDQIRKLADGRIYTAQQALGNGLIDKIGFFEEAIAAAKKRAGLTTAQVIEYRPRAGFLDLLMSAEAKSGSPLLQLTPDAVNAWSTPRVMMLWRG